MFVAAAALISGGCEVYVAPPAVVVAPAVEIVPATYVWDGVEYVGEYNGQFYYFGPGGAWIVCDSVVWGRFYAWEGVHPDWRLHVYHNEGAYRIDRAHAGARYGGPRPVGPRPAVAGPRPAAAGPRPVAQRQKAPAPAHAAPQKKQADKKDEH